MFKRSLIKAYQRNEELDKAIALCQTIAASDTASKVWGQNFLTVLSPDCDRSVDTKTEILEAKPEPTIKIQPKTLSEFKQFCQDNLRGELQALERKRQYTLKTIFGSAIVCLIFPECFLWTISHWIRINNSLPIFRLCWAILIPTWIVFIRGCIHSYRVGFKRNIIESIVDYIGDRDWLHYAAHLFIENKRQTILAFTRSQIIGDETREPDYLAQEDCVYGKIGNTEIFFAEIFVENRLGAHLDESGEQYLRRSLLFHGLFFEAKFPKSFVSRTFVMSRNLKSRISPLNSWRGEVIKLEDPRIRAPV